MVIWVAVLPMDGPRYCRSQLSPACQRNASMAHSKGSLSLPPEIGKGGRGGLSNPYSFSGATLALILSRTVNDWHSYTNSTESVDHNSIDAEIERLRINNEVVLYSARFCEVAIKQLLYCTQIPEKRFSRMALGALLKSPCPSCKKENGRKPHSVSMVGTLAHPFHLCLEFEHCAMDHMALVNTKRNSEAAHSDIQMLNVRTVAESKAQLARDCDEILSGFIHMLSHLESLELRMLDDLVHKGEEIMRYQRNGLTTEDCNFNLVPGKAVELPQISRTTNNSATSGRVS